jgi:hypothetical protein
MRNLVMALALALPCAAACTPTQPTASAANRGVPAKCTACHLAPREHSLRADRWPEYLRRHERRLRISDDERALLHDYLVGGPPPAS